MSDLRIVLLGNSLSETSSVGNFILGRAVFDTEAPSFYLEQYCERVRGKQMMIINTPYLLNPDLSLRQIAQGVREFVFLSAPGPHVIVLVLNHDECSREEAVCVELVLNSLSDRVFEHTMVLTTQEPKRVELNEVNDVVKEIIQKCFNRHYRWGKNSTSADLIATFQEIVQRNDGHRLFCYKYLHSTAEATEQASQSEKGFKKLIEIYQSDNTDHRKTSTQSSSKTMERDFYSRETLNVAHKIKNYWNSKISGGSNETLLIYKLYLKEKWQNIDGSFKRYTFGENITKESKTIMMIGATGAGKTTLINSMINYILGVKWEDDFRFVLIDEGQQTSPAESQTSEITAYKINHMDGFRVPYSLTIVDTPGLGNTRGIKQDQKITAQIREFFSARGGIDCIDAVCFVVQASLARLTHTQKYVFDSILSIFGKDIAENIMVMVTFADGKKPPVLEPIKVSEVPCSTDESGEPLHFKFNNSAVFAHNNKSAEDEDSDCENFDQMFWKLGFSSMHKFFTSLSKIKTQSLTLTREVLKERKQLEVLVVGLQPQINAALTKLDEIKKTRAALKQHMLEMEANKDFEYEVEVTKYKWTYVKERKKETYQDLKKRFEEANGEVMTKEKIFAELEYELEVVQKIVTGLIGDSKKSLERLQEIALKPNPLSTPDYIDLMIESEKQEAKPGFTDRIQSLMEVRKNAETISKIPTGGAIADNLKIYKFDSINSKTLFSQTMKYVQDKIQRHSFKEKVSNAF
ncbi:uncharacterized protein si:ch73-170d6.2 isoform X2 [Danio rerio]|uniref:Uncharacterized protein si:ch73-170d6.2 isoform X2 n=1 Tax=Danio rerio TaxID=7955 RepID=A0AC58JD80_DANRE